MVYQIVLGAAALLGFGWFSTSLVASLAEPTALLLAGASGATAFVEILRNEYLTDYFSSDAGEFLGAGIVGAAVFYLVFVAAQAAIVALSPLAGLTLVGLGVAVFIMGPGILFDVVEVVSEVFDE